MAKTCSLGVEDTITLATTCTVLTVSPLSPRKLQLNSSTTATVYVVVGAADGAALPSTGREAYSSTIFPITIDVSGYGVISLAAEASGTCRFLVT